MVISSPRQILPRSNTGKLHSSRSNTRYYSEQQDAAAAPQYGRLPKETIYVRVSRRLWLNGDIR